MSKTVEQISALISDLTKGDTNPDQEFATLLQTLKGEQQWLEEMSYGIPEAEEASDKVSALIVENIEKRDDKHAKLEELFSVLSQDESGARLYVIQNILMQLNPSTLPVVRDVLGPKVSTGDLWVHLMGGVIRMQGDPEEFEAYVKSVMDELQDHDWFSIAELYVLADRPEEAKERLANIRSEQELMPDIAIVRHAILKQQGKVDEYQALARAIFRSYPIPAAFNLMSQSFDDQEVQEEEVSKLVSEIEADPKLITDFIWTTIEIGYLDLASNYVINHRDVLHEAGLGSLAQWVDSFSQADLHLACVVTLKAAMKCLDEVPADQREMVGAHFSKVLHEHAALVTDWQDVKS